MAIDHLSLHVPEAKYQECLKLYLAALKPLGYEIRQQLDGKAVGMASSLDTGFVAPADFWVISDKDVPAYPSHLAFRAPDRASVEVFYNAAIKAGGVDNGKPGLRTMYHANYYGAFVIDAAGNNIEAVCHRP
ncbi:hypothetical protein ABOM_000042 [Aspergillus bombycis]|uniref:Glyoxalase family protein n=1 Tax=Aspergillus bombycis TaxID=109264 RepID=A0A1F8AHN1_9EURO|nr:hypothetical protein ABOM_000042 [Aspergillus bombycis]OGM51207.1 hypothetical protein ABOM_000042 [Aspergillus bombycis]